MEPTTTVHPLWPHTADCGARCVAVAHGAVEGMATGLACVVDERCSSHLVEHGCNGFTVRSGDVEAYYTHMRRLCDGAEGAALRKRLGDEGRRTHRCAADRRPRKRTATAHRDRASRPRTATAHRDRASRPRTARAAMRRPVGASGAVHASYALARCCARDAGRAVEQYEAAANTQEILEHYRTVRA
jgi:hypothetical protein